MTRAPTTRRANDRLDEETERALAELQRATGALMSEYADHPMDLADASIVVMAEERRLRRVFTLDRRNFLSYRARHGHRRVAFELLPD